MTTAKKSSASGGGSSVARLTLVVYSPKEYNSHIEDTLMGLEVLLATLETGANGTHKHLNIITSSSINIIKATLRTLKLKPPAIKTKKITSLANVVNYITKEQGHDVIRNTLEHSIESYQTTGQNNKKNSVSKFTDFNKFISYYKWYQSLCLNDYVKEFPKGRRYLHWDPDNIFYLQKYMCWDYTYRTGELISPYQKQVLIENVTSLSARSDLSDNLIGNRLPWLSKAVTTVTTVTDDAIPEIIMQ